MSLRLHLDENIASAVAAALRARDVDVTTTQESGLLGRSDLEQLDYCRADRRVLVTHDVDFLVLASQGISHAGILFNRQEEFTVGRLVRQLTLAAYCLSMEEMQGHVEYL